ncbi:MAG TPA: NADPH:quinone reductase [Vicinamibacterales bacterium]|nr:NADPH:quinone reductase [Vicinamibacterales bacterium]
MQAILVREFGGPEVLKLEDVPDPAPGPSQVLVRVHAAGVNPFDTYMRTGTYAMKPALPYTPGADGAGVVEAAGAGVTGISAGTRVFFGGTATHKAYGAYAQMVLCEPQQLHALPDRLSFSQGAGVGVPYVTAWRALHDRARLQPGETLFVHGASGGVGLAATQIARAWGATVIGTGSTPDGLEAVRSQGAHHVLNHRQAGYVDALAELTGGRGPDVILENLANVNLDNDLTALAFGGRVVVVGNRGRIEIDPRKVMSKDAAIVGMALWNTIPADWIRAYRAIEAGLESGTLAPLVSVELPLAEAARSHELILEPGAKGKIVLIP